MMLKAYVNGEYVGDRVHTLSELPAGVDTFIATSWDGEDIPPMWLTEYEVTDAD